MSLKSSLFRKLLQSVLTVSDKEWRRDLRLQLWSVLFGRNLCKTWWELLSMFACLRIRLSRRCSSLWYTKKQIPFTIHVFQWKHYYPRCKLLEIKEKAEPECQWAKCYPAIYRPIIVSPTVTFPLSILCAALCQDVRRYFCLSSRSIWRSHQFTYELKSVENATSTWLKPCTKIRPKRPKCVDCTVQSLYTTPITHICRYWDTWDVLESATRWQCKDGYWLETCSSKCSDQWGLLIIFHWLWCAGLIRCAFQFIRELMRSSNGTRR